MTTTLVMKNATILQPLPFRSSQNAGYGTRVPTQLRPPFAQGHILRNAGSTCSNAGFRHSQSDSIPLPPQHTPSRSSQPRNKGCCKKRVAMAFGAHSIATYRNNQRPEPQPAQNLNQRRRTTDHSRSEPRRRAHHLSTEQVQGYAYGHGHQPHTSTLFHSGYGPAYGGRHNQMDFAQFTQRPDSHHSRWPEAQMPTTSNSHSVYSSHRPQQPSIRRDRENLSSSCETRDGRSLFTSVTMKGMGNEPTQFPPRHPPRHSCLSILNETPLSSPESSPPMVPMVQCGIPLALMPLMPYPQSSPTCSGRARLGDGSGTTLTGPSCSR